MIAQMLSLASLHAPRRAAASGGEPKRLTRGQAFHAWFDAVVNHVGDYELQRAARADFERIAEKLDLGEMCGDLVRVAHDVQTVSKPMWKEVPQPVPVREGKHRFSVRLAPKGAVLPGETSKPKRNDKTVRGVEIGARVRAARIQAGYESRKAFAVATLFPLGTMHTIESGYARMTPEMIAKVGRLLGVSASWLLTGKGEPWKGGSK